MKACMLGLNNIASELLKHESTDVKRKSKKGETALALTVKHGKRNHSRNLSVLQALLAAGADPREVVTIDSSRFEPLFFETVRMRRIDQLTELLKEGADINAVDSRGE